MKKAISKLHDIVFREASDFFSAVMAGIFEGIANNFFTPGPRDDFYRFCDIRGQFVFQPDIEVFFIFSDNDKVHFGVFCLNKWGIGGAGADIGKKTKRSANSDIKAFEAAALRGGDRGL